jgi:folate-binding protein YgfZ
MAAKTAAAIVEEPWLGVLRLTGADRVSWLQSMVTNDVLKLKPGQGCYAGHLTAQGKLIAQMLVLAATDNVWLIVDQAAVAGLATSFDKLIIMEDVQIEDVSNGYTVLGLIGPNSADVIENLTGMRPSAEGRYSHESLDGVRIVRNDLGYLLIVPGNRAQRIISMATTSARALPIDHKTWNVLRTEAGLPLYGVDIDESTTLPELGETGISYDKGCYIGQEVVAKIKYLGHVNRRFVGFVCEDQVLPEEKSVVQTAGKPVGYITTSVVSPALGKAIALGFVNRAAAAPGTSVEIAAGGGPVRATVSTLPFVIPVA